MSETPQTERAATSRAEVPPQSRGQEGRTSTPGRSDAAMSRREPSAWVGWVLFASMMMVLVGAFQVIVGLTALFNSGYYVVGEQGLVIRLDYTAWGWTHIVLGAVAVAAAFGLMAGRTWARAVGIAMALVSAIVNLAFVSAHPLWSVIVIALDVIVIYAIAAHGRELQSV